MLLRTKSSSKRIIGCLLSEAQRFSLSARMRSFRHAAHGLRLLWREQHNARVHLIVALTVVAGGALLKLTALEWAVVLLLIGWVISVEALNSALEYLCDKVSPTQDPIIGKVKDVAAAAVLVSAVTAVGVGLVIFAPKLWELLGL